MPNLVEDFKVLNGVVSSLNKERNKLYEDKAFWEGELVKILESFDFNTCGEKCRFWNKRQCAILGKRCFILDKNAGLAKIIRKTVLEGIDSYGQLYLPLETEVMPKINMFKIKERVEKELEEIKKKISEIEKEILKRARGINLTNNGAK